MTAHLTLLAALHLYIFTTSLPSGYQVRVCSLTTECVLLLQNVFSYYRMCSLTMECVLLLWNVFSYRRPPPCPSLVSKRAHSVVREHIL